MTHEEVLAGMYKLTFRTYISTPTSQPVLDHNGLKLWYIQDGFICTSPMRSFTQGNCKFVFPYKTGGGRAYISYFANLEPLKYRQVRNSGTIQISGNKNPVNYRDAIAIVYKNIVGAIRYKGKFQKGYTKINPTYLNNAILNESNDIKPVSVRNGIVYTLFVDFKQRRADYRDLISQEHILKLREYVLLSKALDDVASGILEGRNTIWSNSFGFSKDEFINLIDNCDK